MVQVGSAFAIVAFCICLYLAYIMLRIEVKNASHVLLIISAVALGFWNVFAYCVYNAGTIEQVQRAFLFSTIGMFVYVPVNNAFAFFVLRSGRTPWWYLAVVGTPVVAFASIMFADPGAYVSFSRAAAGWRFIPNRDSPVNLLWLIYFFSLMALCQLYLGRRSRDVTLIRERSQIRLLIVSGLVAWVPALIQILLHDTVSWMPHAYYTPVILLPWAIGNVLAVNRYQFLRITPEQVTQNILKSMRDLVILANADGTVTYMNDTALQFFDCSLRELQTHTIDTMFQQPESAGGILPDAPTELGGHPVSRRITVADGCEPGSLRTIDMEIGAVHDRFGDFLGYLLVGSVIETPQFLMHRFHLTQRECEMVQCILNGWDYPMIASSLHISASTIKSHISHIYQKLHIHNRMELIRLVDRHQATGRPENISAARTR